jgi:hypothetical protein
MVGIFRDRSGTEPSASAIRREANARGSSGERRLLAEIRAVGAPENSDWNWD